MILHLNNDDILPEGTCSFSQFHHYKQIASFIRDKNFYKFSIPVKCQYGNFIIAKNSNQNGQIIYRMYFQANNSIILSAQEKSGCIGCSFVISNELESEQKQNYIGKLRGNFQANEFHIYNNGNNPNKKQEPLRHQLGYIEYKQNILSSNNKDNKMILIIPKQQLIKKDIPIYQPKIFQPQKENKNLLKQQYLKNSLMINVLKNRTLNQNIQNSCQKINNQSFQNSSLILSIKDENPILVLKRRSQKTFIMNIGFPLTILQAICIFLVQMERQKKYI